MSSSSPTPVRAVTAAIAARFRAARSSPTCNPSNVGFTATLLRSAIPSPSITASSAWYSSTAAAASAALSTSSPSAENVTAKPRSSSGSAAAIASTAVAPATNRRTSRPESDDRSSQSPSARRRDAHSSTSRSAFMPRAYGLVRLRSHRLG